MRSCSGRVRTLPCRFSVPAWLLLVAGVACRPGDERSTRVERVKQSPSANRSAESIDFTTGDSRPDAHAFHLRDITETARLVFRHRAGGEPFFVPRSIGSGAALLDADGDGKLDLYLVQNAGPESNVRNCLLRQTSDLQFEDISAGSGLDVAGWGMGCAAGDVNNDGRVDLLLTEYGRIRLFLNDSSTGSVRFRDVTQEAQLENPGWATSVSFLDYDVDGALDLVVVNYLDYDPSRACSDAGGRPDFCGPQVFAPVVARLFRQVPAESRQAIPRFEDVTLASGLGAKPGAGLGVACADFTGDGRIDIFTANDGMPNHLWVQQANGTFSEEAGIRGLAYNAIGQAQANMGVAWGDANGDGRMDLFVTHRANEMHTLWSQQSEGLFADLTVGTGISKTKWRGEGFGTVLADLDRDQDLDLALVNGLVLRAAEDDHADVAADVGEFWRPYAQRNQILMNGGNGMFSDSYGQNRDFCGEARVSRGLACGDLNDDGKLELLVTTIDGPARLYQATGDADHHWLIVRAVDPRWKRDAYGAQVFVTVGDQTQSRQINPGYSFLTSNDPRAHFGLGSSQRYDRIRVVWPDGLDEIFDGGEANRVMTIERGAGRASSLEKRGPG